MFMLYTYLYYSKYLLSFTKNNVEYDIMFFNDDFHIPYLHIHFIS